MLNKTRQLFFLVLFGAISGCSTIQTHSGSQKYVYPYIGTAKAIAQAKKAWSDYDYYGEFYLYASDVPLCFIADTIILPYDLYRDWTARQ